jgi:hypothetical protein
MRRLYPIVSLIALLAIAPVLAGCEDFDMDKLDVFGLNKKKKLPGERHEVFPNGVPGVSQGIPPEYLKGNQQSTDSAQTPIGDSAVNAAATPGDKGSTTPEDKGAAPAGKTAALTPAEEPKPKPKPKRKPKPRTAAHAPTQIKVQPVAKGQNGDQQQNMAPWPSTSPQPAQQQGQPPASGQSSSTAPWPSAPPPDTFSR